MANTLFITGTDTSVGKTLLTALLLTHLRRCGLGALAMKPFASGSHADASLLNHVQNHALTGRQVNPFYFDEPVAPLSAARRERRTITLAEAVRRIQEVRSRAQCLLIEGCGGLLTPLGRGFTALEIIEAVGAPVVVVAANRLGVLNHAVLTLEALASRRARCAAVVLMGRRKTDASTRSNKAVLAGLVAPVPVLSVPYLGPRAKASKTLAEHAKKCEKTLARIAGWL